MPPTHVVFALCRRGRRMDIAQKKSKFVATNQGRVRQMCVPYFFGTQQREQ